jgi:hypothetical protein
MNSKSLNFLLRALCEHRGQIKICAIKSVNMNKSLNLIFRHNHCKKGHRLNSRFRNWDRILLRVFHQPDDRSGNKILPLV